MSQKPPGIRRDGSTTNEPILGWTDRGEMAMRFRGVAGHTYGDAQNTAQSLDTPRSTSRDTNSITSTNQWNLTAHLPPLQSSFFNPTPQPNPAPTSAITPAFPHNPASTPRHIYSHSYPVPTQHPLNHMSYNGFNNNAQPYPQATYPPPPPPTSRYPPPVTAQRIPQYPTYGALQPSYLDQTIPISQQYRPYQFQSPSTSSKSTPLASSFHQRQYPQQYHNPYPSHSISIPSASTSAPSSGLPSPAYTQSPIYPFTPLAQSFSQLPTHGGWERPLTIPTSVLAPPSAWDGERFRKGSYNSCESTDDGIEAPHKVVGQRESSVEYSQVEEVQVEQKTEEEEDEECISEVSVGDIEDGGEVGGVAAEDGGQVVVYTTSAEIKQTQWIKRRCYNCGDTDAPSWRRSVQYEGFILCNKCGIYERTNKRDRPLSITAGVHSNPRANSKASKSTSKAEKGYKARKPTPLKISPRKNGGGRRSKVESGPPSSVPTSKSGSVSQIPTPNSSHFSQSIITPFNSTTLENPYHTNPTNSSHNNHTSSGTKTPPTAVSASLPPSATTSTFSHNPSSSSSMKPPSSFPTSTNEVYHNHNTRGRSVSTSIPNSGTSIPSTIGNRRSTGTGTGYGPYPLRRTYTHAYSGALRGSVNSGGNRVSKPSYTDDLPLPPQLGQGGVGISEGGVGMLRDGSGSSSESSYLPTPKEEQVGFHVGVGEGQLQGLSGSGSSVGSGTGAEVAEEGRGMGRDDGYVVSWMIGKRGV